MTGARNGAMHVWVDDAVVLAAFHPVEAAIARIALGYEVACAPPRTAILQRLAIR